MRLSKGQHVHLMGVCGTAMASLAGLLKDMGYKVTGSDQNVYPPMSTQLENLGIEILQGYKKENLNPRPDLVIVGNVIRKEYEEAQALLNSDIPYTSLPKALGEYVIDSRKSIVVAGTHGKTTTTSMLAQIADRCEIGSGFLVGGIPENFGQSFRKPTGDWFIIEGDEYDTAFFDKVPKFVHYKPRYVIFSSLEFDHADIYQDLDQIRSAFQRLMELIPEDGILVFNSDDPEVVALSKKCKAKTKISYGLKSGDYRAVDRQSLVGRNQFSVQVGSQRVADLAIKLFGAHNTLNALGAYALARELKWPEHLVLQGFAEFKGVRRRQSLVAEVNGVKIIDDFAHHPTAVTLTIESIKEQYPNGRVLAVFEPRTATSRRKIFQTQYAEALSRADLAFVAVPYDQSRIPEEERFSADRLKADIEAHGGVAILGPDTESLIQSIRSHWKPGDIVLIMSNGGFDGIHKKLSSTDL